MGSNNRQETWLLWIIGIFGVLVALGLVVALAWFVFFRPLPALPFRPSPTVTQQPDQPSTATAISLGVSPTATAMPTSTATSTAQPTQEPSATSTPLPATPTLTVSPTFTHTPFATLTQSPLPTSTLSPYGTVNTGSANIRYGPGIEYPIIGQASFGESLLALGRSSEGSWILVQITDGRQGWISSSLISLSPGLSLPFVAAPPLPPTVTPTPTNLPASTATPTTTAGPPPTSTLTPTPCPIPVGDAFSETWRAQARSLLGCPTDIQRETWTAVQPFQYGKMYWREDLKLVYSVIYNGYWQKYSDQWEEGMPDYSCPGDAPAGLIKPRRGFGLVWCTDQRMRSILGWALEDERGIVTKFQAFQHGEMLLEEDEKKYILLNNNLWQLLP